MNPVGFGIDRILRGFRQNSQASIALGVVALFWAFLRRERPRTLLSSKELAPGERVVIELKPRQTR